MILIPLEADNETEINRLAKKYKNYSLSLCQIVNMCLRDLLQSDSVESILEEKRHEDRKPAKRSRKNKIGDTSKSV